MSMTLYNLSEAYINVLDLIDEENPDSDFLKALRTIESSIEIKAVNIANLIKSLEADAKIIKEEEKRLKQRRESKTNAAASIKQYLSVTMEQMKMDLITSPTRTVAFQDNPPALVITNRDIIPQKYLTLIPEHYETRNDEIKDDLKAGVEVPGAELSRGRSLRIR